MKMAAKFSPDMVFRYRLDREWGAGPRLGICMLNPSTADEFNDDRTIAKCVKRAQANAFGSLTVVNLYAYRATDPKELWYRWAICKEIIGPDNDHFIREAAEKCDRFMVGWGATIVKGTGHTIPHNRDFRVLSIIREAQKKPLLCLGITKYGFPRHPLYIADAFDFEDYIGWKHGA